MRLLIPALVLPVLVACAQRQPLPEAYTPGLGEIMAQTANRHAKLWFAGQAGNWPLAEYELDELAEGFEDAGKYHPTHKSSPVPLPRLIADAMNSPMSQLEAAVKAKDGQAFTLRYDALTRACNACHLASNFGFNVVVRPAHNPFANQSFAPAQ